MTTDETNTGETIARNLTSVPAGHVLTPSGWMPRHEWERWIHSDDYRRMTERKRKFLTKRG